MWPFKRKYYKSEIDAAKMEGKIEAYKEILTGKTPQPVRVVNVNDGDTILLFHPGRLTPDAMKNLRDSFVEKTKNFKNNHFVVLEEGLTLGVLRKDKNASENR